MKNNVINPRKFVDTHLTFFNGIDKTIGHKRQ